MYTGTHARSDKGGRRFRSRKATVLLASLALMICLIISGTTAYLIATDTPITNIFNPSEVTSTVNETFDGDAKSNVTIKNTGDIEAYIRAAVVVTWKDAENGNIYGQKPAAGTDYSITFNTNDWFLGTDGFWYCKAPVAAGGSTPVLISSCAPVDGKTPAGYGLNAEILGSAIQSVPAKVVQDNWGVTVGSDGSLS